MRDKQIGRTWCRSFRTNRAPSVWRACSGSSGSSRQVGQLYRPQDADQLMFYKEDKKGQILQEGINEAGALRVVDRRCARRTASTTCR